MSPVNFMPLLVNVASPVEDDAVAPGRPDLCQPPRRVPARDPGLAVARQLEAGQREARAQPPPRPDLVPPGQHHPLQAPVTVVNVGQLATTRQADLPRLKYFRFINIILPQ